MSPVKPTLGQLGNFLNYSSGYHVKIKQEYLLEFVFVPPHCFGSNVFGIFFLTILCFHSLCPGPRPYFTLVFE